MITQHAEEVFAGRSGRRRVSIIVPLYNYERYILETIESALAQTFRDLEILVIDDGSTDSSCERVADWMRRHQNADIGLRLFRNQANARLAVTRNTGIDLSDADYCFFLDADNALYPRCIEKHVAALDSRLDAAAAYSLIEVFGARAGIMGAGVFERGALARGNFIDAMSMVRRSVLIELDGFRHIDHGWEDYDLWLRLCEAGGLAIHLPEILSRYREHASSMLRTDTNIPDHISKLHSDMIRRHPWLELD